MHVFRNENFKNEDRGFLLSGPPGTLSSIGSQFQWSPVERKEQKRGRKSSAKTQTLKCKCFSAPSVVSSRVIFVQIHKAVKKGGKKGANKHRN